MLTAERDSTIIKDFLTSPLIRESFHDFYNLCLSHTIAYLLYLQRKNVRMPVGSGKRDDALKDLTIDVLGTLFRNDRDRPFHLILEHFDRIGSDDYDLADPSDMVYHLEGLLRGHAKQELSKLKKAENPQIENLKRRFKEVLNTDEYGSMKISGIEHVYLCERKNNLRLDKPAVPYDDLVRLAEASYQESTDRKMWCSRTLISIDDLADYQNLVKKHELLMAVVSVNSWYVDLDLSISTKPSTPRHDAFLEAIRSSTNQTLEWAEKNVIGSFVGKGRISENKARRFRLALSRYLDDFGFHGEADPVPEYFRETMPPEAHLSYLKDYKYVFETIITKALEYFRESLKKESTGLGLGDYIEYG